MPHDVSDSDTGAATPSGSPRPRDAKATKAEILATAEALFLAKGFANTTVNEIAERVGVAKSLIYHHFGSKERLWQEVREATMREYLEAQARLFEGEKNLDVVRESLRTYFNFLQREPKFLRLDAWVELEGPTLDTPSTNALAKAAVATFDELQRSGELRDDIDPAHLLYVFVGVAEFWLAHRKRIERTLPHVRGTGADDIDWDEEDERFIATVQDVIFHGVIPREKG